MFDPEKEFNIQPDNPYDKANGGLENKLQQEQEQALPAEFAHNQDIMNAIGSQLVSSNKEAPATVSHVGIEQSGGQETAKEIKVGSPMASLAEMKIVTSSQGNTLNPQNSTDSLVKSIEETANNLIKKEDLLNSLNNQSVSVGNSQPSVLISEEPHFQEIPEELKEVNQLGNVGLTEEDLKVDTNIEVPFIDENNEESIEPQVPDHEKAGLTDRQYALLKRKKALEASEDEEKDLDEEGDYDEVSTVKTVDELGLENNPDYLNLSESGSSGISEGVVKQTDSDLMLAHLNNLESSNTQPQQPQDERPITAYEEPPQLGESDTPQVNNPVDLTYHEEDNGMSSYHSGVVDKELKERGTLAENKVIASSLEHQAQQTQQEQQTHQAQQTQQEQQTHQAQQTQQEQQTQQTQQTGYGFKQIIQPRAYADSQFCVHLDEFEVDKKVYNEVYIESINYTEWKRGVKTDFVFLLQGGAKVKGVLWDIIQGYTADTIKALNGNIIKLDGTWGEYQGTPQIKVKSFVLLNDTANTTKNCYITQTSEITAYDNILLELYSAITDPALQFAVYNLYYRDGFLEKIKQLPAAKAIHDAKPCGLFMHKIKVAHHAYQSTAIYPEANKSVVIASALFHDIGKVFELTKSGDYTRDGQLFGHIYMGARLLERYLDEAVTSGFTLPQNIRDNMVHCVLAHHGKLEWGSPVEPKTVEAAILHTSDMMDANATMILDHLGGNKESKITPLRRTIFDLNN